MLRVPGKESCATTKPAMGNCICKMATKGQGGKGKSTSQAQGKKPYSRAFKRRPSLVQAIPLAALEWSCHASDTTPTSRDPPSTSPKPCALDTASQSQEVNEEGNRHPSEEVRGRKRMERKCRHHKLGKAFDREMLREAHYLSLLDKMDLETQEDLDRWYSLGSRKLVK